MGNNISTMNNLIVFKNIQIGDSCPGITERGSVMRFCFREIKVADNVVKSLESLVKKGALRLLLIEHNLVSLRGGGGLIDFDDDSVVLDGFWSGCRGQFLICRLYHTIDIQSRH